MTDETDKPAPDVTTFELWAVDDQNREHVICSAHGLRADALLEIIADLTDFAQASRRMVRDMRVYEVVRVPVDLDVLGRVQQ